MPQELWSSDAAEPTTTTGPYVGHNIGPLLDHSTVPSADVASPNDNRLHLPQASTENHGWLPSVPTDGMLPPSSATTAGRPCQPPPYSASSTNYQASSSVYGLQHSNLQAASHNAQQVPHDDPSFIQGLEELRQIRGTLFVTANNPYSGIGPAEGFFVADDDQADFPQTPWLIKDSRYDPNAYLHSQTQQGTVRGDMANAGTYQGPIPSEGWQTPQQLHPLASTSMSYYPGANPTQRQAREFRASGGTPTQWQVNQQFGIGIESMPAASSRVIQESSSAQVMQQTSGGYTGKRRAAEEDEKQDDWELDVQQRHKPQTKLRGGGRNRGGRGRRGSVARDSGKPSYSGESVFEVDNHWQHDRRQQ